MNVGQLKKALEEFDDGTPVIVMPNINCERREYISLVSVWGLPNREDTHVGYVAINLATDVTPAEKK